MANSARTDQRNARWTRCAAPAADTRKTPRAEARTHPRESHGRASSRASSATPPSAAAAARVSTRCSGGGSVAGRPNTVVVRPAGRAALLCALLPALLLRRSSFPAAAGCFAPAPCCWPAALAARTRSWEACVRAVLRRGAALERGSRSASPRSSPAVIFGCGGDGESGRAAAARGGCVCHDTHAQRCGEGLSRMRACQRGGPLVGDARRPDGGGASRRERGPGDATAGGSLQQICTATSTFPTRCSVAVARASSRVGGAGGRARQGLVPRTGTDV